MKQNSFYFFIAALAFLTGCATGMGTGRTYHVWNATWQLGYQDTALREGLYRVSYTGYGLAPETCADFALLRAAEIVVENHTRYFDILDEKQSSASQAFSLPGSSVTTGQVLPGGQFSAVSTSYAISGSIDRPTAAIVIHLRKDGTSSAMSLDAPLLVRNLRKKHALGE